MQMQKLLRAFLRYRVRTVSPWRYRYVAANAFTFLPRDATEYELIGSRIYVLSIGTNINDLGRPWTAETSLL